MIGPSTTPSNPNTLIPPSTLMKTRSPPSSARPLISHGRHDIVHQAHNQRAENHEENSTAEVASHHQADRGRNPDESGADDGNERKEAHHDAPEKRRSDSRHSESKAAEERVYDGGGQAGGHTRENQLSSVTEYAVARL